jgi:hypothetical protein
MLGMFAQAAHVLAPDLFSSVAGHVRVVDGADVSRIHSGLASIQETVPGDEPCRA